MNRAEKLAYHSPDSRLSLIQVVQQLLRPIVRFCLRRSLKIQDVIEAVKQSFVEVAQEEMTEEGHPFSVSRLSVMTGIHRRETSRLAAGDSKESDDARLLSKIIGKWVNSRKYQTQTGRPRALTVEGKQSEFVELVKSINRELNPYTVLFELERTGVVERTSKGLLKLIGQIYIPRGDARKGLMLLASDTEDLIECVSENVYSPEEIPNLHIRTEFDGIRSDCFNEVKQWVLEKGTQFQMEVEEYLASLDQDIYPELKSEKEEEKNLRIIVGSFSRVEKK